MHIDEEIIYFINSSPTPLVSYTYKIRTHVCEMRDSQGHSNVFWLTLFWVIRTHTLVEFTTSEIPLAFTSLVEGWSVLRIKCDLLLLLLSSVSPYIPETNHVPREHCVATILM
jgi:hypothetical protein